MDKFLKIAVAAARESGRIQLASLGKAHRIRFKGEINLVTEVDGRCEEAIMRRIRRSFPDHEILSEESGMIHSAREEPALPVRARGVRGDGARMSRRRMGQRSPRFKWIIDPLDGTTNFSHGYPLFCTSIALEHLGRVLLGVVFDPNRRDLFHAVRGRGAYLNGRPIRVSSYTRLKRALLSTGFAYNVRDTKDNNIAHFENFIMTSQAVRRDGVAATDLCYVACGRFDGFWELGLWPWDVAAGALILEEAGGRVSRFDGGPLDIYGKEIVASNGRIHKEMVEVLRRGR